jgi:hypothetical protein
MIPEPVAGLRPTISDDSNDLESRSVLSGPLEQKLLHSEVELLVGRRRRPWDDPMDFSQRGCSRVLVG